MKSGSAAFSFGATQARPRRLPSRPWPDRLVTLVVFVLLCTATDASAQTDYFNTDANRPVRIEDANPVERYAFELQLAPLRLTRTDGGEYHLEIDPALAYGILPRTYIELGLPLEYVDEDDDESTFGVAGIDLSLFHNLNTETRTLPAFAVIGAVLLPVGSRGPDHVYPSVTGILTRSFRFARFHVNGQYTFGETPDAFDEAGSASRWLAGIAIDKAFPLKSALLIADVYTEELLHRDGDLRWVIEAGARYQLDPYFALDFGIGRRFSGDAEGWQVTLGAARSFAIRSLMPVPRR